MELKKTNHLLNTVDIDVVKQPNVEANAFMQSDATNKTV